jgi:adenylate kinase family enzyme
LESIFDFYKLEKPVVINIDISKEQSIDRLMARGRIDDNREDIAERLSWYETDVAPAIAFYENNPKYNFIKIDGNRSIEDVYKDIIEKANLK